MTVPAPESVYLLCRAITKIDQPIRTVSVVAAGLAVVLQPGGGQQDRRAGGGAALQPTRAVQDVRHRHHLGLPQAGRQAQGHAAGAGPGGHQHGAGGGLSGTGAEGERGHIGRVLW